MFRGIERMTEHEILRELISLGEDYTRNKRSCAEFEDCELFATNVTRVMQNTQSGREFLQAIMDGAVKNLPEWKRASYFDALNSKRRLAYVKDVCFAVLNAMDRYMAGQNIDYLANIPELKGRYVAAGDGHSIAHAVHEKKINKKYPATSCIYMQNLRNGLLDPMTLVADPKSSKPHEVTFLKKQLQQYGNKNNYCKPIIVYDRAAVDKTFWTLSKHQWTIVTRMKNNLKPAFKHPLRFDQSDPMNEGVISYSMIGLENAGILYQVEYIDSETREKYTFITNDKSLRPGVVAYLYKIRWWIEKAFDVLKNKLFEQKAWAESLTSKKMQVQMIAFTYNFLLFLETMVEKMEGEYKSKAVKKRNIQLVKRVIKARKKGRELPMVELKKPHMLQITQQFIRCVRSWILKDVSLASFSGIFIERLTSYI
jgi:Transposase DDE domain